MRKSLFLALAVMVSAPAALPAQEKIIRVIPTDWTLANPAPDGPQARASGNVRRPQAAPRKPKAQIFGGATVNNRVLRGRKKAQVGMAVPF